MFSILHLQYCLTTSFSNDFCFGRLLFGYLFLFWIGCYRRSGLVTYVLRSFQSSHFSHASWYPWVQRDYSLVPFYVPLALEDHCYTHHRVSWQTGYGCFAMLGCSLSCPLFLSLFLFLVRPEIMLNQPEWMWCYLVAVPLTLHHWPIAAYNAGSRVVTGSLLRGVTGMLWFISSILIVLWHLHVSWLWFRIAFS